jgi:hypothetical protein
MAVTYEIQNSQAIVIHQMIGAKTKVQKGYESAAHYLWNRGYGDHGTEETPIVWNDLTNQEKLNLVHAYLIQIIREMARTYLVEAGKITGGETGQTEYEETVEVEDV